MRTFIAVEVGGTVREWLSSCLEVLRRRFPAARWVKSEQMHLTLKFLGEVDPARIAEVEDACRAAASRSSPFLLEIGAPGWFGRKRSPRAFWMGFAPGDGLAALLRLQSDLESSLEERRFPREDRPFTPHLTLGRNPYGVALAGLERVEDWAADLPAHQAEGPPSFAVRSLHLFSSELGRGGPTHRLLLEAPLGGEAGAAAAGAIGEARA